MKSFEPVSQHKFKHGLDMAGALRQDRGTDNKTVHSNN